MINTIQLGQQWWNTWRVRSVNTRIFAAMVTVGGLTVLVKLVAGIKELVVAYQFGTSDALDAFIMAYLLPQFVMELIGGALTAAFIPTYIQVLQQEGQAAAQRLLSTVMASSIVLLVAASVLLTVLVAYVLPILASGFDPDKLALTRRLYFVLMPTLLCWGFAAIWSAVLNAGERFALAAVIPIVTPLVTVLLLWGANRGGIMILAIGTVLGLALEAGLLGWNLKKRGVSLMPWWYEASPAVKQVFRQYAPAVTASLLMGSAWLIAQSMAATLGPGSVSALAYGSKATTLLLGIGSVAVSTAVLPHFSRMVAVGDSAGVRHTLKTYAWLILLVTLPLAVILMYYSEPLVRLILQRGAFTPADTHVVSQVQAIYLFQVPFVLVGILFVRVISSLKANHLLLWGTVINLILTLVFNYIFLQRFQVVGIALATSLMFVISTSYFIYVGIQLTQKQAVHKGN
jgi:putative peptidoglycan lipid II flippase